MNTTKFSILFILVSMLRLNYIYPMEEQKKEKGKEKLTESVHNDSDDSENVTITINLENHDKIILSSQWTRYKLSQVKTLHDQYAFAPTDDPTDDYVTLPKKQISEEQWESFNKALTYLTPTMRRKGKQKKEEEIPQAPPTELVSLLHTADFLNCPTVLKLAVSKLTLILRKLVEQNQLQRALNILNQLTPGTSFYMAQHMCKRFSKQLTSLSITLNNETQRDSSLQGVFRQLLTPDLVNFYPCYTSNKVWLLCNDKIKYWDLQKEKTITLFRFYFDMFSHQGSINYSPSKKILFITYWDGLDSQIITGYSVNDSFDILIYLDIVSFKKFNAFAFDENNLRFYFTYNNDDTIYWYEFKPNQDHIYHTLFQCHNVTSLCLSKDKKTLYSLSKKNSSHQSSEGKICFWNLKTQTTYQVIPIKKYWNNNDTCHVHQLEVSPDGSFLALGTKKDVTLFNAQTGEYLKKFNHSYIPFAFSPDSKTLIASRNNGLVEHTLKNRNLTKLISTFSAQHIALLYACIQERKKSDGDIFKHCVKISEQTMLLFSQLPRSIQSYFDTKKYL